MKRVNYIRVSIGVIIILVLGLAGCASVGTAATTPPQSSSPQVTPTPSINTSATPSVIITPSASAAEEADDILFTPGGFAYRANVQQTGVTNPWPPVQEVQATLGSGNDILQVTYRNNIETQAGQTRNNIFTSVLPNVTGNDIMSNTLNVTLMGISLPAAITVAKDDGDWHDGDPGRRAESVLKINISSQVTPGDYNFEIEVAINGKDYGQVPCTVKVSG